MRSMVFVKRARRHQECFSPYLLQHLRVLRRLRRGATKKSRTGEEWKRKQRIPWIPHPRRVCNPLVPKGSHVIGTQTVELLHPLHASKEGSQEWVPRAIQFSPVEIKSTGFGIRQFETRTFSYMYDMGMFISPSHKFFICKVGMHNNTYFIWFLWKLHKIMHVIFLAQGLAH